MTLYLDTEFNTFGGQLISLALASTTGDHWYGALPLPPLRSIHPWVREHVVPKILIDPFPDEESFKRSLWEYLYRHPDEDIYADWPENFAHLMMMLCKVNGVAANFHPTMHLIHSGKFEPVLPHNALSDAVALMKWHVGESK